MRILALGDVVGTRAVEYLSQRLWTVRKEQKIDFTIVNGENASEIRGINARDAQTLLDAGADIITLGNHAFGKKDLFPLLERGERIIRPANFPPVTPGSGYTVVNICGWKILCMNVNGRAFMDAYADPFDAVEKILTREAGHYDLSVLDIHAEATSEKLAIAYCFDGRVNVMYGTHTHVQTADERILPHGSGYITDLGMCGPVESILGCAVNPVISRFRTMLPTPFCVAEGDVSANGAIFTIDSASLVTSVSRLRF